MTGRWNSAPGDRTAVVLGCSGANDERMGDGRLRWNRANCGDSRMGAMPDAAGASRGCADAASGGSDDVGSRSMSRDAGDGDDIAARTGGLLAVDRVNVVNGEPDGATDSRCRAIRTGS